MTETLAEDTTPSRLTCPLTGETDCEYLDEYEVDDIQGCKPCCMFYGDSQLIPLICPTIKEGG